jgi:hypothetical protein
MSEPATIVQQLRASVKLIYPELLAEVPQDYDPRQTFNFLRHKATNYDELMDAHRSKYGSITPAEQKALTQGAADAIIAAFRGENEDLLKGKSSTVFAKFVRKLAKILGIETDAEIDLQAIYEATVILKRSQAMYKSWNERYRRQKKLVLSVAAQGTPELHERIKAIYEANSDAALSLLEVSSSSSKLSKKSKRKKRTKLPSYEQLSLPLLNDEDQESNGG